MDYGYKTTTHGRAVMAACMDLEKPLKITRVAFGGGRVEEGTSLADVHALLEYVSDGAIADRRHEDDRFRLTIQYANSEHKEVGTFLLSEFIVYVEDPETGNDTDLLYGTLGDYRQPVPAWNPAYPPSVFSFPLTLILSDEITVSVSAPAGLVTYDDLQRLMNEGVIGISRTDVGIPAKGWTQGGGGPEGYPYYTDIKITGAVSRMTPCVTIYPQSLAAAAGLCPVAESYDGGVRLYAKAAPAADIKASIALVGGSGYISVNTDGGGSIPIASADTPGAVKPGDGLTVTPDGTISVDSASDVDTKQMLDGVFTSDNK